MPNYSELKRKAKAVGLEIPGDMLKAAVGLGAESSTTEIKKALVEQGQVPSAADIRNIKAVLTAFEIEAEVPVTTAPETKQSVDDEIELIPTIDSDSKKTATAAGNGNGTEGDFNGYFGLDLPDLNLEDVRVELDGENLKVEWKKKYGGFTYIVVGSPNGYPLDVIRGRYRWLTKENSLVIPQGEYRFFTIFAFKEKGSKGKQYAQGMSVEDITEIETEAYENEVRLRWNRRTTDGVVKLVRSAPNQNLPVPLSFSNYLSIAPGASAYTDVNVNPGDTYEYRVFTEWKNPSGEINETRGSTVTVTTPSKVPFVEQFQVTKQSGNLVEISYLPLPRGEVRVYQLRGLPSADLIAAKVSRVEFDLKSLESGEYKWLGTRIIGAPESLGSKITINAPMLPGQKDSRTYIAISVLGSKARISDVKVVQQVGEIEELEVIDRFDYVLLRVSPPAGADALDVWVLNENANLSNLPPTRRVQIEDEYRRFGGIIFADDIAGLDVARSLGAEAKKIVVRGVSTWDGSDHLGEPTEVLYPGRLSVHYRAVRIGPANQKGYLPWYAYIFPWIRRRYLKVAQAEHNTTDLAKFEIKVVGNRKIRPEQKVIANHFVGTAFPIDKNDQGVVKVKKFETTFKDESIGWMMENKVGVFEPVITREEAETMVGNTSDAKRARAKRRSRDRRGRFLKESEKLTLYNGSHIHRMLPIKDPTITETIFSIDETRFAVEHVEAKDANLKVVIIGPKRSGKTTYVQALINYLRNQLAIQMRARLIAEGDDEYTIKKLQEMEGFITQGNLPLATQSAKPFASGSGPISLNDPRKPMKFVFENGESVPIRSLQITDVAGEDMDELETMRLYKDAISQADLVIFLVDPLQIKHVRVALAGRPLPQEGGADPFKVLLNLGTLIDEIRPTLNVGQKYAVVISKFDGIEELSDTDHTHMSGTITPGIAVTRDPMTNRKATPTELADLEDNLRVHNEAIAILERLKAGDFLTLVKNKLPLAQYFVVSALGHASYNDRLDSAGISSFRISDPIRWAAATKPTVQTMVATVKGLYEDESAGGKVPGSGLQEPVAAPNLSVKPEPLAEPFFSNPQADEEPAEPEIEVSPDQAEEYDQELDQEAEEGSEQEEDGSEQEIELADDEMPDAIEQDAQIETTEDGDEKKS